jgi:actin-related protein
MAAYVAIEARCRGLAAGEVKNELRRVSFQASWKQNDPRTRHPSEARFIINWTHHLAIWRLLAVPPQSQQRTPAKTGA